MSPLWTDDDQRRRTVPTVRDQARAVVTKLLPGLICGALVWVVVVVTLRLLIHWVASWL
jgi:hypothetical protein